MDEQSARKVAAMVAGSLINTPYVWGGDDPVAGFDCSGFVIEILKSAGRLPRQGDWRAKDLYRMFKGSPALQEHQVRRGCLVFWSRDNNPDNIIHVELAINDALCIGASGGGSATVSMEDAIQQNAYIKVRPFRSRGSTSTRFYADPFAGFDFSNV